MKAAVVHAPGASPEFGDFPTPSPQDNERLIHVTASSLTHVARSRASGAHYSSAGRFPFVAGIDGTGRLDDGKRVYFVLPRAPNGAMAEQTVVATAHCVEIPDDLDDVTAAAIANPGVSSWAALSRRARLKPGETVLVNGAAGTAGRLAIQIARHLGAGKIIATARNPDALKSFPPPGADVTILLEGDPDRFEVRLMEEFAQGVDIVIDYLWGQSAEAILVAAARAGADASPMRFVHIGAASGADIKLPGAVLRASAIELMGSGLGSIPFDQFMACIDGLLKATVPAGLRIATNAVTLADVARFWNLDDSTRRTVFRTGA